MPKPLSYNVCFFGARSGDVLVSRSLGVRLILHGDVPPCGRVREGLSEEELLTCLSRATGFGYESCREELARGAAPDDHPNHRALGQDCRHSFTRSTCAELQCPVSARVELLELGDLRGFAQKEGNLEALESLVGVAVPFWQILALCGKHTLSLRRSLYHVDHTQAGSGGVASSTLPIVNVSSDGAGSLLVELPSLEVALRMDASHGRLPNASDCRGVALDLLHGTAAEHIDAGFALLRRATPAFLKSLLQKIIRHFGTSDPVRDDAAQGLSKQVLLVCTVLLLFQNPGSFVPELQTFVRGCVSLLKRVAVIAVEDGFPAPTVLQETQLSPRDLLLIAFALRDYKRLQPSLALVKRIAAFCLGCLESPRRIDWQAMIRSRQTSAEVAPSPEWKLAHGALCGLGAMQGDKDMFRAVAEGGALLFADGGAVVQVEIPFSLMWAIDFHCVRGILHGLDGGSFSERKQRMFKSFTGVNPRGCSRLEYDLTYMANVKSLQAFCWERMTKSKRPSELVAGHFQEYLEFDSSPIAYMVGDVNVRLKGREYIVTLGTKDTLAEEVVIAKPSRAARDILDVSDDVRDAAISAVRRMRFPLASPFPKGTVLYFEADKWVLEVTINDDISRVVPADEYCSQPLPLNIHEHPPATLSGENCFRLAAYTGSGFRRGWWDAIEVALLSLPKELWDRLLVVLSSVQSDGLIEMPVYSLQEGSATSAKDEDEKVYVFLLNVAVQCPSAVEAEQIPTFRVRDFLHFLFLRQRIKEWVFERCAVGRSQSTCWIQSNSRVLKPAQALGLDKLQVCKRRVQFLFAPTGAGKTFTALSFVRILGIETVIWVAPDEVVAALVEEIPRCVGVKVVVLDARGGAHAKPEARAINVVRYDHAKVAHVLPELKAWAARAALVLDEADKLFGETKRSSAMLELAHVSAYVLMMSATVLRSSSNVEPLFAWANLMSDFPTSRKNLFVFYSTLVNFQREAAVKQAFETSYVDLPITDAYRRAVLDRRWLEAATCMYTELDAVLAARALEAGPTFLVGRNQEHVDRLLGLLRRNLGGAAAEGSIGGFVEAAAKSAEGGGALRVCVVPLSKNRGYNFGKHYRRMVLPPLPSSVATRVQLFGRLTRMDQEFQEVTYVTVVPKRTILEVLYDRHTSDDAVQASIEKLGERFGHLAEAMLRSGAGSEAQDAGTERARPEVSAHAAAARLAGEPASKARRIMGKQHGFAQ